MTVVAVDLHAGGAGLPGLDLLGLPQADRGPPHPAAATPAAAAAVRPLDPRLRRHLAPGAAAAGRSSLGGGVAGLLWCIVAGLGRHRAWSLAAARRRRPAPPALGGRRVLGARGGRRLGRRRRGRGAARRSSARPAPPLLARSLRDRPTAGARGEVAAAGHPRRGGRRALPDPLPARPGPGRRAAAADGRRHRHPGPAERRDRAGDAAAGAGVRGTGRAGHRATGPASSGARMASLSGHFLDVVRGLPTLVAHRRAARPVRRGSGAITDRYRRASLRHAAARLRLLGRPRAGGHAVGRPGGGHGRRPARRRRRSTCAPRSSCCCSRPRRTGRCAGSAPSSTPPPRASRPSRPPNAARPRDRRQAPSRRRARRATLVLDGLSVTYPGRAAPALVALDAVSRPAASPWSPGPSGCGKSTLLAAARRPARAAAPGRCWSGGTTGRRPEVAQPGRLAAPAAGLRRRHRRRQPPPGPPRTPTTSACGRRCAGSPSRSACATCPAGSTRARRGRRHAVGRRAGPARPGPRRARRPALGAPRRAHRPPRRRSPSRSSPTRSASWPHAARW